MYGYTEDEALKMKIWNIIPEHLHGETQQTLDKVVRGEGLHSLETKRITKHGKNGGRAILGFYYCRSRK